MNELRPVTIFTVYELDGKIVRKTYTQSKLSEETELSKGLFHCWINTQDVNPHALVEINGHIELCHYAAVQFNEAAPSEESSILKLEQEFKDVYALIVRICTQCHEDKNSVIEIGKVVNDLAHDIGKLKIEP